MGQAKITQIALIFLIINVIVLLYSPLLALWVSIASFALAKQTRMSLRLLILVASAATSLIIASQLFAYDASDDFIAYYENYELVNTDRDIVAAARALGSPWEVGLPTVYFIIGSIFSNLSPPQLQLITSFLFSILALYSVLSVIQHKGFPEQGITMAVTLSFISLSLYSQLIRQGTSTILIFLALYNSGVRRYVWLAIAFIFHVTALPIFLIVQFLRSPTKLHLIICALTFLLVYAYFSITGIGIDLETFSKLATYANADLNQFTSTDLGNLKVLAIGVITILSALYLKPKILRQLETREGLRIVVGMSAIFLLALPLPVLSTRLTMFVCLFLIGYYVGIIVVRLGRASATVLALAFSLMKPLLLANASAAGPYWINYAMAGLSPGYYLTFFLRNN